MQLRNGHTPVLRVAPPVEADHLVVVGADVVVSLLKNVKEILKYRTNAGIIMRYSSHFPVIRIVTAIVVAVATLVFIFDAFALATFGLCVVSKQHNFQFNQVQTGLKLLRYKMKLP